MRKSISNEEVEKAIALYLSSDRITIRDIAQILERDRNIIAKKMKEKGVTIRLDRSNLPKENVSHKVCKTCLKDLPIDNFPKLQTKNGNTTRECKSCHHKRRV